MQSPVASILQRAALLFGTSGSTPVAADAANSQPVLSWRVEREESPHLWRVDNLSSGASHRCKDEQHALTLIEYATVQALVDRVKDSHRNQSRIQADAIFAMHGALLCKDGFGIIVVGPSEAGKSTLSCALWQNGWSLWSDDFCFFKGADRAFPAARRVSLRSGSRALLGEEIWTRIQNAPSSAASETGWLFHPHEVEQKVRMAVEDGVLVRAFIFLGRRNCAASAAQLQLHNPALAAIALLPYCTLLPRDDESGAVGSDAATAGVLQWGVALPRIAAVAGRVPVYDLGRGPLPEMVAAIKTLL